jgi:predicted Zn-dependent protease with MMP-like domain
MRMSPKRFREIAEEAVKALPAEFQPFLADCALAVEPRASRGKLEELGVPEDEDLFGLYEGVALIDRHLDDLPGPPPRVTLYFKPLLEACATEAELRREIQLTVLHEVGHHFGLDEKRLEELGFE